MEGDVAALVRSHTIGSIPFERTIERTTQQWTLALKTIAAVFYKANENKVSESCYTTERN